MPINIAGRPLMGTTSRTRPMLYTDIETYPRGWDKDRFPVIAHIEIDAARWAEFDRLASDQTQVQVLAHDLADDDRVVAHVGCTSDAVKRRLENRWA